MTLPAQIPPAWFAVLLAGAAALPATFTLAPMTDPDTWWHLQVGEWVREHGTVPETDPFSRMSREQPTPWLAYSWLFDLGLLGAYTAGGLTGVMLARSALGALSTVVVLGFVVRRLGPTPAGAGAAVLAGVVLMPLARERSWHVTIAFTTLTLAVVTRVREEGWTPRAWWLPAAFALWANLHIQFVLGWGVLGLGCLFPGRADRRRVVALTAACVLATFVNPYHVRLLSVVWEYATQTGALRGVMELSPPEPATPWPWVAFAVLGWGTVNTARRRPIDGFSVLLLVVGAVLSLRMRRDLWFGVIAGVAAIRPTGVEPVAHFPRWAVAAVVAGTFAAVRAIHLAGFGPPNDFAAAVAEDYPEAAVAAVRAQQLPGPLFNYFDWGGYLIWALPEHPVSIDGRTNLYGDERVSRSMNTRVAGPGWDADPDLTSANLVIVSKNGPLTDALRGRPHEWRIAFEDATAVVFVRAPR